MCNKTIVKPMKKYLLLTVLSVTTIVNAFAQNLKIYKAEHSCGTFMLVSEKGKQTAMKNTLNLLGYDVCVFNYKTDTIKDYNLLVNSIKKEYLNLKNQQDKYTATAVNTKSQPNLHSLSIAADGKSCLYAAQAIKYLDNKQLPQNLVLTNAQNLETKALGDAYPLAVPPYNPAGSRLFLSVDTTKLSRESYNAAYEFYLAWVGFDGGTAKFLPCNFQSKKSYTYEENHFYELQKLLKSLPNTVVKNPNPAEKAVKGYDKQRHDKIAENLKKNKYDIIFLGNSITHNYEKTEYQPVWNKFFGDRNAINIGTSGYRTENLVWELENLDFNFQKPKLVVIEIGTNNIDRANYPYRCTATELALGMHKLVRMCRQRMPSAKVILLRCFPGSYDGEMPTSHRMILERASELVSQTVDNKNVFYVDINHVFKNYDGSINQELMGDCLHPTPLGAELWLKEMEPWVCEILNDKPHCEFPQNTAIVPTPKLEEDCYNWYDRHDKVLKIKDKIDPQIILIGNSITHFWGGEPSLVWNDGTPRKPNGQKAWDYAFGDKRVLNLGFGWDRTQNVLWRLNHGEVDNLHPEYVVIHIGTNNTSDTPNARINTADEICEGVAEVCKQVRSKMPYAKIILMSIFPREEKPDNPRRILINQANEKIKTFAEKHHITLIDLSSKMLDPNGILSSDICGDYTHPTEKGYMIWAEELKKILK